MFSVLPSSVILYNLLLVHSPEKPIHVGSSLLFSNNNPNSPLADAVPLIFKFWVNTAYPIVSASISVITPTIILFCLFILLPPN